MPEYDLPIADLERFSSDEPEPADLDEFWADTLAQTRAHALDPRFIDIDEGYPELLTQDVRFAGYDGDEIRGWFIAPRRTESPLPVVVSFMGYGGGRGLVGAHTWIAATGVAQLVMDVRGQGSRWRTGDTADGAFAPDLGAVMTRGIASPQTYYFRRLFTDAVRAIEAAAEHPLVDEKRIITHGGSQGGALSIAAAALSRASIGSVVEAPFLSMFRRATRLTDREPYREISQYLRTHRDKVEQVFATLSYFDVVNLARRADSPALFMTGLLDDVTPPSTVFAAFNAWQGDKSMIVYPFNGHEGGEDFSQQHTVHWIRKLLGARTEAM